MPDAETTTQAAPPEAAQKPEPKTVPLRELQQERAKRQELEKRLAELERNATPKGPPAIESDDFSVDPKIRKQAFDELLAQAQANAEKSAADKADAVVTRARLELEMERYDVFGEDEDQDIRELAQTKLKRLLEDGHDYKSAVKEAAKSVAKFKIPPESAKPESKSTVTPPPSSPVAASALAEVGAFSAEGKSPNEAAKAAKGLWKKILGH